MFPDVRLARSGPVYGLRERGAAMTHTSGPWLVDNRRADIVRSASGTVIAVFDNGNKEANAALGAAAPDLLDALKGLLPEVDAEIEQRQHSGNDEYWQGLKKLSDAAHFAVIKAEARP
jgi:hypothetical protein